MDTAVYTASRLTPLELYERGKSEEALGLLEGVPAGPERWLVEGAAIALAEPENAKDLLSKAADGLAGDLRDKANIWLACCYWATGEITEAVAILDSVQPQSDQVRFLWGYTKSVFEIDNPEHALTFLVAVEGYADHVNPVWRGKFHNQRGAIARRLCEPDKAILDYEEARYWFTIGKSPIFHWGSTVNLAGVLADQKYFDDALQVIDQAIAALAEMREQVYLAQAQDQKAQILLAQGKFIQAGQAALRSVAILKSREQRELLARSLITEAESLIQASEHFGAHSRLDQALRIGEYLNNQNLIFDVSWQLRELADKLRQSAEYRLVKIAYEGNSIRGGAKRMKIYHHAFQKFIKKHGLERTPETPARRILIRRKK